jgi:hypothetical protein
MKSFSANLAESYLDKTSAMLHTRTYRSNVTYQESRGWSNEGYCQLGNIIVCVVNEE